MRRGLRSLGTPLRVVTPLGRSLVVVGVLALLLDRVGGWPGLRLVAVGCLVLVLLGLLTALVRPRLRVGVRLVPRRTVAGSGASVEVTGRRGGLLPVPAPLLRVPVGDRAHELRLRTLLRRPSTERIEFDDLARGVLEVGPVRWRRSDAVGVLGWQVRTTPVSELLVLPRTVRVGALPHGSVSDQEGRTSDEVSMSDLAFHALREYVPGDDLRHVHWRSSARSDALQVRQYLDTRRSHLTLVVDDDPDSYPDPEDFETAVSVAASLALRADEEDCDLSLLCGDHAVTGRGVDAVLDVCCRVTLVGSDAHGQLRHAMRLAPETSWLVLCTGPARAEALAGAMRGEVPGDVALTLVRADRARPSTVGGASGVSLLGVSRLEELPGVLGAVRA